MNIKDLQLGSYTPISEPAQPKLNVNNIQPGTFKVISGDVKIKNKPFKYDVPAPVDTRTSAEKIAQYNKEQVGYEQASKKANSFGGILGNTIKGVGTTLASSEIGLGKTIAKTFGNQSEKYSKIIDDVNNQQVNLIRVIKDKEAKGGDASSLKRIYNDNVNQLEELNKNLKEETDLPSTGKVLGQLGGTALDVLSAGTYGKAKTALMTSGKIAPKAPTLIEKGASAIGIPELSKIAEQKATGLITKKGGLNVAKGAGLGYANDVTMGLQGDRGENRTGGKAFIPGLGTVIGASIPAVSESVQSYKNKFNPSEDLLQSKMLDKYNKGVKPLLPSRSTPVSVDKYNKNVLDAVDTIKANKENLNYLTDAGETVSGQTPKTLQQFTDAIEQTKKSVFTQYDELAKKAGKAGVGVETTPIANELDSVINNKALSITNPKAIEYATQLKDRLIKTGKLDATTAQEVIQNYNKSLEAFYRNPSYDSASNVAIDAMVANNMREALDKGITGLTGSEYQVLKNKYGSLKAVERDVIKATLRDIRKNIKGLIDLTDIFSGSQLLHGLVSLNPATITQGIGAKAIAMFYKHLNNPNRAIENVFKLSSKLP